MKALRSERVIFIAIIIILLIVIAFFLEKTFHRRYTPPTKKTTAVSLPEQPLVTCAHGDTTCTKKNEAIQASRLQGPAAIYAKHQCDGPRPCPTPDVKINSAAIKTIQDYTKKSTLPLTRVTGINATNIIYYCANDNKCWGVDSETEKVVVVVDGDKINNINP